MYRQTDVRTGGEGEGIGMLLNNVVAERDKIQNVGGKYWN